jgi:hypothetical protein
MNYTCRIKPTCRSLGAPCHKHWSCHRAPGQSSLWTSQCWAKCWRSSWKEQRLSLQVANIVVRSITIFTSFWRKAEHKQTHNTHTYPDTHILSYKYLELYQIEISYGTVITDVDDTGTSALPNINIWMLKWVLSQLISCKMTISVWQFFIN